MKLKVDVKSILRIGSVHNKGEHSDFRNIVLRDDKRAPYRMETKNKICG